MDSNRNQMNASWLSNIKRLFSKDVIIRDQGNGRLKAVDINQIQQNGGIEQNYFTSKMGSSVYQSGAGFYSYPNQNNYQIVRQQLYQEYEMMDRHSIINTALNVYAQQATLKNDEGNVLKIISNDEKIKETLTNLFYNIIGIKFNAYPWARNLCKYGDHIMFLKFAKGYGIVSIKPLSPYSVQRIDDIDEINTKFIYQEATGNPNENNIRKEFDNYEIAHFRLMDNSNMLPYGISVLEGARQTWKALTLIEDAALCHRIIRSADKRAFYIYTGSIPANERDALMQKVMAQSKKTPHVDPISGEYDLRYNMMNMMEDYYIPVPNGDNKTTRIENISGLNFAGMEDVNYYKNNLFAALQVPKAIFGDSEGMDGKSQLAVLHMLFGQRIERIQAALLDQFYRIAIAHLYAIGYTDNSLLNFELELQSPSIIYEQEKIARLQEKVELASQMIDNNLFSYDYIYEKVFNISEDEYDEIRDTIIEDKKRSFRYSQIENEGNDPIESGLSYGTPHDLAMAYNDKINVSDPNIPSEYDETKPNPEGRPSTHASTYGTDDSVLGRDPIGKKKITVSPKMGGLKHKFRGNSPMSLNEQENKPVNKKVNIYEYKSMFEKMKNLSIFDENQLQEIKIKEK